MNIAAQNSLINSGMMEARYEHKLPITLQIMFNHQLSKCLSIETGLSYTRLASTISTGSKNAYIQEQQRLHYLGIPFRLGWRWYSMAHLSLYSSAGMMLELPIKSAVDISHIVNGINTFQKETSLDVPCQLSGSFGLNTTSHLTLVFTWSPACSTSSTMAVASRPIVQSMHYRLRSHSASVSVGEKC